MTLKMSSRMLGTLKMQSNEVFAVGGMMIEKELLDDFENELKDARYFKDAK
jgi:hypothetical protein